MKNIYYFISFALLFTSTISAQAQVIASEDFNYTVGSTIGGANGGTGWGGPWTIITGNNKTVIADSIKNFRTGKATGTVLDVNFPPSAGNVRMERALATPITDNGNTYWFGVDAAYEGAAGNNVNVVALVNTAATVAAGAAGQLILIGKQPASTGTGFLGLGTPPSTAIVTQKKKIQDTYWMVVKVKFSGNAAADTVYLFLNPDPAMEPVNSKADVVYTVATGLNAGFNGIYVKVEGTPTGLRAKYDNMILGNTYADIIPTGVNPLPKYRQVREKFNYGAGTAINTNGSAGNGWAAGWQTIVEPGPQSIVAKRVENGIILKQTKPNALEMNLAGETRLKRDLAYTYQDNGLTYWLSFFASIEGSSTGNVMNVMLVNNAAETMAASDDTGQLLQIGKMSNNQDVGLGQPGTGGTTVVKPDLANRGNWYVARIETNGTSAVDTVRLFLNPSTTTEPAVGTELVKYAADNLNKGWKAIGIKVSGSPTTLKSLIDDVYLGLAYDEVVPEDLEVFFNAPDPAFDKFTYAENTTLSTTSPLGFKSDGWNGPWKSIAGEVTVKKDSVDNYFNLQATRANALEIKRTTTSDIRLFRGLKTAYADNGRSYWMGFWYNTNSFTLGETLQIILGDTTTFAATGDAGQFLRVGIASDNKNFKLITASQTEDAGIAGDTARWVVLKIETNGTTGADSVRLFLDPAPGTTPANSTAIRKMATTELNAGWNGILVRSSGATATLRTVIDDLYIGNSFQEITPSSLATIVPFDQPEVAYEPFNYALTENLNGKGTAGSGWGGAWAKISGDNAVVESGSIETDFTVFEGNKVNINYTSQPVIYDRKLKTTFKDNGSTVWMSFLMDFENVQKISSEGQLVLMKDTTELIGFGRTNGFNKIGFTWGPDIFEFISDVNSQDKHWIVVRIDMSNNADAESIYMWIDPIPEFQPANSTADVFTNSTTNKKRTLNEGFDGVRLKTAGSAPFQMFVDEFRIGYTYGDVSKIQEEIPENLVAREQFRYGDGEPLPGLGNPGTQWGSTWRLGFDGGGPATVEENSLTNGSRLATAGGQVLLDHTTAKVRVERDFAQFYEDDGTDYWLSFLADFSSTGTSNEVRLFLTNYRNFSGNDGQRLGLGKNFGNANIGINSKGTPAVNSTIPATGVKWYLTKLEMSGNSDADSIFLWINHNPEYPPLKSNAALKLAGTSLNNGFQGIMLKAESASPAVATRFRVDEIRFGKSFESVAPLSEDVTTGLESDRPQRFRLGNHPNPFNEETTITFELEKAGHTEVSIFDSHGRELSKPINERLPAGKHERKWSTFNMQMPPGLYLCRLSHASGVETLRLLRIEP
jgi:hypothetical protein